MSPLEIVILVMGIVLGLIAVALVTCVLLQSGKEKSLSSSIAGGSESFFGGSKSKSKDKVLSRITTVLAIVFFVLVVVLYVVVAVMTNSIPNASLPFENLFK